MRITFVLLITAQCFLSSLAYAQTHNAVPLKEVVIHPTRSAPATAQSLNNTILSSQLLATVTQINARISQTVKRGDILLTLDCTDYQLNHQMTKASADAANARLKLYKSQLNRAKEIYAKALMSEEDVDIRATEVIAQQALVKQREMAVKLATLDTTRCDIKAPFNGIITQRNAAVGQLTKVGDALLTIVDTETLALSAKVSYDDAQKFNEVADFVFDFGSQLSVSILHIGGVINSQTRNQEIRFSFPAEKPLPGTAGKLQWSDPQAFIPSEFIVQRNGVLGIFINNNNTAQFTPLEHASPGRPAPTLLPLETFIVIHDIAQLHDGETLKAH